MCKHVGLARVPGRVRVDVCMNAIYHNISCVYRHTETQVPVSQTQGQWDWIIDWSSAVDRNSFV